MKELNFDEWLSGYKKKYETAKYMSKVDLKKAFKDELKTLEQQKLAAKEKEKAEAFRRKEIKANEKKAQKQKAKEEALAHIIQKVTDGDAERLSYGEINAVVENFFAHEESFRKEEADLRCRLYALTLTNSTLQGLIQTTILSRLISGNSSNGAGATTSGGNSMGKALVAASLLNNQQLKGMAEDVEDISEGFGLDEE